ncbi:DNA replication ATP-dependent helicase/nuclease DNA2-like isoform X2 [Patiria miniata]|uniref:DNA replication ATP-dependent helicase/nuclease DNA2 n=1 Tax=Patiria miniata TaxID=46514 RepID=A0A913Z7Z1_PATMI|nr:DNA replication ATP-dependent helicase/nuclease DNA2-like isoform X2 [Patiria miniata]
MGKTLKKSETGTGVKGQTSLNSFFSKKPPGGQSKLFTQVLPGSKPCTALPQKATAPLPKCHKLDDDYSDFQPRKKQKSPPIPTGKSIKPGRTIQQTKDNQTTRKFDLRCERQGRLDSLHARHQQQDEAKKNIEINGSDNDTKAVSVGNIQNVGNTHQDLSDHGLSLVSKVNSMLKTKASGCVKPQDPAGGNYGNTVSQESQGSPITVIPETPEAILNSDRTRPKFTKLPHKDDSTPIRNLGTTLSTFVPETPSAEPERVNKAKTLSRLRQDSTPKRGGVRAKGVGLGRSRDESQCEKKSSSFKLFGDSAGLHADEGSGESQDLLQEMLEEFAQSAKRKDGRSRLPSQQKSLEHGVTKTQGILSKSGRNPFANKSKGLVSKPSTFQESRLNLSAANVPSINLKSPQHIHEDLEETLKPPTGCDLEEDEKQDIDPLEEMLQEYAASSSVMPCLDSTIAGQSTTMSKMTSLGDRPMLQAKRPSSKLSRTLRKKQRSGSSPAKHLNLIMAEIVGDSTSDHQTVLPDVVISTDKIDLVRDIPNQNSVNYPSEEDLFRQSTENSANPFALKPSKVKLKAAVMHKPGSCQSKMAASKTWLTTRKRSPSKGNSPYAKRLSTNHPSWEVYNYDTDMFTKENSPFQQGDMIPQCTDSKKPFIGTSAKKSLFQKEKENLLSLDSEISEGSPSGSDASPRNLADRTNILDTTGTASTVMKEKISPNAVRLKEKSRDFESAGANGNKTVESDQHREPAGAENDDDLLWPEDVRPSQGTGALWESQLNDSLLAAMDMECLESAENSEENLDSMEAQVTRDFNLLSPFKSVSQQKKEASLPADLNRYRVTGIQDCGSEKVLQLLCLTEHKKRSCRLKGTWLNTLVEEGDTVAVHGRFDSAGMCTVDQQNNFLVVHPDRLLTGTNVSRSIRCMRRSVLSEKFKGMDRASKPMLLGTMLHEVFDKAIERRNFNEEGLLKIVDRVSHQLAYLKDMYAVGMTEQNVLDEAQEYVGTMKQWAERYLQPMPKQSAAIDVKMPGQHNSEKCNICVSTVKEIEETVWSPRWGTKGKVDLTVEVKIHQRKPHGKKTQMTVPLELKTGRQTNSIEHRSQLVLYSLMLGDIHDGPASDLGLLLYLKTGAMLSVPANHMDKRELIHLRNQLAYYINLRAKLAVDGTWTLPRLPAPIEDDFTCGHCPHLVSCAMLQRIESEKGVGHQLSEAGYQFFSEQLGHLSPSHMEYFSRWYLLCTLEGMAVEKKNHTKHIWSTAAQERELSSGGHCLSGLLLAGCRHNKTQDSYHVTFKRSPHHPDKSLLGFQVSTGDRVAVSVEGTRRIATCTGFVESITSMEVTIKSERPLKSNRSGSQFFRMDKDDAYNSMASSLVNLARLLLSDENAYRLRKLVVDLSEPQFDNQPQIPDSAKTKVAEILGSLNSDQQTAIKAVLRCQDYTLIIGMPGTGKTTTIVALVRILCACDLSVLLTSYTHSAVDNILLKLTKFGISPLRLGEVHRVHPELTAYTEKEVLGGAKSVQQLASLLETKLVVATTCLGAKHTLLTRRKFDVCIVDEASQISQLVCLGPLFHARRFVLVGDHKQLPPLVQSTVARQLGMDESLFQRLGVQHEANPLATVQLSLQYRMNSDIMMLSNTLVYDGKLRCGNEKVAMTTLNLPKWDTFKSDFRLGPGDNSWVLQALQPATTVCFLNTDKVKYPESSNEKHTVNSAEAMLVKHLVQCLMKCGCEAGHIGIISPYRNQCKLLGTMLGEGIEVNTVDKYQGRDKDVIIVSFVAKDQQSETGFLLQDIRRLNVALTRAKHKLILIGCIRALRKNAPMEKLMDCLQTIDSISTLPVDACSACIPSSWGKT